MPLIASQLKKDFEKATKKDIEAIVADIEATGKAHATKLSYAVTIKKFYKWLNGGDEYPKSVKWLRTTDKRNNKKLPEDLLTEDEIKINSSIVLNQFTFLYANQYYSCKLTFKPINFAYF